MTIKSNRFTTKTKWIFGITIATVWAIISLVIDINSKPNVERDDEKMLNDMCPLKNDSQEITGNTMHLALIVEKMSDERAMELNAAFTSLLYSRTCPVHLHLAFDDQTRQHFDMYIRTSEQETPQTMRNFSYTYYDTAPAEEATKDLETKWPYRAALWSASPETIFKDQEEVLVVDFDLLFLRDLCPVYHRYMNDIKRSPTRMMAFAPELSLMYNPPEVGKAFSFFSAFGFRISPDNEAYAWHGDKWSGFNAGVYFCNLTRMRQNEWTRYWTRTLTEQPWKNMMETILHFPEQNIFVLGAHNHPEWFLHASPGINYQLQWTDSDDFNSNERKAVLQHHVHDVVVLHGNAGIFGRRNIWSALFYLFANANLDLKENPRPIQFQDRGTVCDQRRYVDDYVLKAAKSFDIMENVDDKWSLKFQFPETL